MKSNPNPNPNPNLATKQHAIVYIQLNIVTCPTYPEKFVRDNVVAPSVRLQVVIVTLSFRTLIIGCFVSDFRSLVNFHLH